MFLWVVRRYDRLSEEDAIRQGKKYSFADMETHPEYYLAAK